MQKLLILILGLSLAVIVYGKPSAIIFGVVKDASTGSVLYNANVWLSPSSMGTTTDHSGRFYLSVVHPGIFQLTVSFMGYQLHKRSVTVNSSDSVNVNIAMETRLIEKQDVMISVSRHESKKEETSLPVAVVTQDQIRQISPVTLADALQTQPGIAMGRDGAWGTRISVRGLSRDKLVTLVDGYRIDTAEDIAAGLSMVDVDDINQVEVILGGISALYGTGAIGGVIHITTKDSYFSPRFFWQGSFSSQYQTVNQLGAANLSFSSGYRWWYLRLYGSLRKAENMQTPSGVLKNSQFQDTNFSIKAGLQPQPHHRLRFNIQRFKAENVGIPGGGSIFPTEAEVRYPDEARNLYSVDYVGDEWFSFLPKLSGNIFRQEIHRHVENIPHTVKLTPSTPGLPAKRVQVLSIESEADHTIDGFQFQTNWNVMPQQILITGLDWWQKVYVGRRIKNQQIDILNTDQTIKQTISKIFGELPLPMATYRSLGLYVQNENKFWDSHLTLVIGGRYDWINTENKLALNPVYEITNGQRTNPPTGQDTLWMPEKSRNHSWSGNMGVSYRWNPAVFSLTVARSFRSPYLEERYQYIDLGSVIKIGNPDLKPEDSRFVDLGFTWSSKAINFSCHVFVNQLNNLVVEQPGIYDNRNALYKMNVGKARLAGFDSQIDWARFNHWYLYTTFSYVRGEDTQTNQPLPAISPFNARIGISYMLTRLGKFEVYSLVYAAQNRAVEGELITKGYQVFTLRYNSNAFILDRMSWRISLGVDNVFNHAYRNHLSTQRGVVLDEPGRNFIMRVSTEF